MSYKKQNFVDGQVLKAEHLNNIEEEIRQLWEDKVNLPFAYKEPSTNLFNKDNIVSGAYYETDGTLKTLSNYGSTELIKCKPNTTYTKYLFGGKVTFYGSNMNFISGEDNDTNYITTPNECRYFRVSFSLENIDKCMIVEGKIDNPSSMEYVPYEQGYLKSDILTVIKDNLSSGLVDWLINRFGTPKMRINPTKPLDIKTYEGGQNQPTHPKVLYFANGWNGHKYWMVYTPYPNNNNYEENPCITYSDDGINWSEEGITNPIIASTVRGCWYSDPHLVYVPKTDTLELWVRWCSNGADGLSNGWEGVYRLKSTDGINWSEKEYLYHVVDTSWASVLSPTVIYDEDKYKIWFVYKRNCLKYYESIDGTNWTYIRDISINPPSSHYKVWHFDIIKTSLGYEFVGCYQYNGLFDKNNFIYYAKSTDNITYTFPARILTNGYDGNFDVLELYRPCLVKINDDTDHAYYNLYYGAQGKLRNWSIGLVQNSNIESLKYYLEQESLYYDSLIVDEYISDDTTSGGNNDSGDDEGETDTTISCTNVSLDKSSLTFDSDSTQTLVATVTPSNTTETLTWESNNTSIAKVSNGVVIPISNGDCVITAKCGSYIATCQVTVNIQEQEGVLSNFDDSVWELGYINESGEVAQTGSFHHSSYMKLPIDGKGFVSFKSGSYYPRVSYFDKDFNYLGYDRGNGINTEPTNPNSVSLINLTNVENATCFIISASTTDKNNVFVAVTMKANHFDNSLWTKGYFDDNGTLTSGANTSLPMYHSSYIPIEEGTVNFGSTQYGRISYFDSDLNYLGYDRGAGLNTVVNNANTPSIDILTNVANAIYYVINANTTNKNDITVS